MLVVFSDLHLSDETTANNVNPDAFTKILQKEIETSAKKNEVKEIQIVLLGDIYDYVRTDYWLKQNWDDRPWNGAIDKRTGMNSDIYKMEMLYGNVFADIMKTRSAKAFIRMLNSISSQFKNNIPVKITYVMGNHDRILNNSEALQRKIRNELTEYDISSIQFSNEYLNAKDYAVLCKHGHEWDENNYGLTLYKYFNKGISYVSQFEPKLYKFQSIGEVITAELMSGIIHRIKDEKFKKTLMEINNVRPLSDAILWLYWFGKDVTAKNKANLLDAFRDSMGEVVRTELAKIWDETKAEILLFKGDITDRFEQMLDLVEDLDFEAINKYVEVFKFFDKLFGSQKDDNIEGARKEFKNTYYKDVQYILYGHTHLAKNDYFDASADGMVKMYINTGTFLPYIQKVYNGNSFASAHEMTMVFIYRRDEDMDDNKPNKYPSMELWNGIKRKI